MIPASIAREAALRSTLDACAFVDDLGLAATGEIVVAGGDGRRGTVFVEHGRVCWAAARGLARRLTQLLEDRAGMAPGSMEPHYQACKERRVPLGEHLVGCGVLKAGELRGVLLQHTAESLGHLCAEDARIGWCPRVGPGYSPRFTFATTELLEQIGKARHRALAARVQPVLETCFGADDWAAAFVRSATSAFPEPIATVGRAPESATALLRFGKWAASVLDVTSAFTDEAAMFSASRAGKSGPGSVVAFRDGGLVITGETSTCSPARILNRRAEQRRRSERHDADL